MKRKMIWLLVVALLPLSCGKNSNNKTATPLPTIPVKTIIATPGTIEVTREFSGGLEGIEQADIYIRLAEAVVSLPFKIGDGVREGEVLLKLDKGGASSQYYQAKAAFENAEKNFEKMKYLFEQKAISEIAFDQAKAGYEIAKANYQAAKELVDITSPITGTLVELNVKVGEIPPVGKLAARVARTETLRMSFGIPAGMVEKFAKEMTGTLAVAGDSALYTCTVTKVSDAAEPQTRTFTVEVTAPNNDRRLQPGTFAKVSFVVDRKENVIAVPMSALTSNEGVMSLFIVRGDTAYARTVATGVTSGVQMEVTAGLTAGEEVVVLGQSFLSEGYPILRSKD